MLFVYASLKHTYHRPQERTPRKNISPWTTKSMPWRRLYPRLSGSLDSTPVVAGVASTVAGAAVIGLALWLRQLRNEQ